MDKDKFLKAFGLNLKIARIRQGLTQEELAEQAGCTAPYIGYVERGIKCPTVYLFTKIAEILRIDIGEFMQSVNSNPDL